jgi:hypothetical protein
MLENFTNRDRVLDFFFKDADTNELFARENYSRHCERPITFPFGASFKFGVTETTM